MEGSGREDGNKKLKNGACKILWTSKPERERERERERELGRRGWRG